MRKLTLTLIGASLLAGSLFAGQNHAMDTAKENFSEINKEVATKNLTPGEKAMAFIAEKYGHKDD